MDGTGRGILPWTTDIVFNLYQYGANRWNGQVDTATAATTKTAAATTTASTHLPTNSSIASGSTWITARGGVINQVTGSVQSIHSEGGHWVFGEASGQVSPIFVNYYVSYR